MPTLAERDPYEVLGVDRDATAEDIKRAYRRQAVKHHPDRNPGDKEAEEAFKQASEAYSILGDSGKRARFDRFGHAGVGGAAGGPVNQEIFRDFEDLFGGGSVFDLFGQMFGGGPQARGPQRGHDIQYELHLDFDEPRRDSSRRIRISRSEPCDACQGGGVEPGARPRSCPRCGGRGQQQVRRGFVVMSHPCGECRGAGRIVDHPCRTCAGAGNSPRQRDITVRLPAGVDDGNQLRLPGEGEPGRHGGPPGDLFVLIHLRPDPVRRREGATVRSDETITFPEAALGTSIRIPTIWGEQSLRIPPGTQPGAELRLRNQGFPVLRRGTRGHHIVRIQVEVPKKLGGRARRAVEELADELGAPPGRAEDESAAPRRQAEDAGERAASDDAGGGGEKGDRPSPKRRSRLGRLFS